MGPRQKAEQALAAFSGERPSLGDRVGATRAAHEAAADVMAQQDATNAETAPDTPPSPTPLERPMPPQDAEGSWVWVTLPGQSGTICARAVAWIRVRPDDLAPDGWALRVASPYWRLLTSWVGRGGDTAGACEEHQVAPSSAVEPIPGRYSGAPRDDDTGPAS